MTIGRPSHKEVNTEAVFPDGGFDLGPQLAVADHKEAGGRYLRAHFGRQLDEAQRRFLRFEAGDGSHHRGVSGDSQLVGQFGAVRSLAEGLEGDAGVDQGNPGVIEQTEALTGLDILPADGHEVGCPLCRHTLGGQQAALQQGAWYRRQTKAVDRVQNNGNALRGGRQAAEHTRLGRVRVHNPGPYLPDFPSQLPVSPHLRPRPDLSYEMRSDGKRDIRQTLRLIVQQTARPGNEVRCETASVEIPHDIQSNLLRAAQLQLGDNVKDCRFALPGAHLESFPIIPFRLPN
jgi:hypothetical protein